MPKLTLEERINKLREESEQRISDKASSLIVELELYNNNFTLTDEMQTYVDILLKSLRCETKE